MNKNINKVSFQIFLVSITAKIVDVHFLKQDFCCAFSIISLFYFILYFLSLFCCKLTIIICFDLNM